MGFSIYSEVGVRNYMELGTLSAYIASNQPLTVLYDPNQNQYTPNWASSNLVITPVVTYNGVQLPLNSNGLTITYKRKEGSGTEVALTTGETVSGNILTVSANKLANVTSKLLTYTCYVSYTMPDSTIVLDTSATLTYTLLSNAEELKYVTITGESTFLYDTNRILVGSDLITLTADLTNVSVSQWQYKKADDTWAAFPTTNNTSITGTSLKVYATETGIWVNDRTATIRILTDETDVYDVHNIVKIYDGAAGTDTITANLSNDNHLLPVTSTGTVRSWVGAETEIHVYDGGEDVTSEWTIAVTNGTGLTGTYNASTHIYTPSALTVDASYAEFVCTKSGYANITKRYTITKQYAGNDGEDAVIYQLTPSTLALNLGKNGEFTPETVTFNAYRRIGNASSSTAYTGRFIISESTDGSTFTNKYTSSSNEASKVYTPSANTIKAIKCILYASGGTATKLDEQTIVVTTDGSDGIGINGENAVSMGLGNYGDVIPCNTSGNASAARDISIPFWAYDGISRTAVSCAVGTLPSGVTIKSNTAGTTASAGLLVLTVASGATFSSSSTLTGDITLTLSAKETSLEQKFTWTKSKQASNGTSAVVFQLYSADGGTIYNYEGSTTISTMMVSGTSTVTPTAFVWAKYTNGSYATLSGKTASTLVVTPDMVDATAWFRCTATYGGKTYNAYFTVYDKQDETKAYTFRTRDLKNKEGFGAVYTRVYRKGEELDALRTLVFSDTPPTSPSTGDFYYHLDTTNKTCTLKKYSGTAWANATEKDEFIYKYYRIDADGTALDTTTPYKTDRVFYYDYSITSDAMDFRCNVVQE